MDIVKLRLIYWVRSIKKIEQGRKINYIEGEEWEYPHIKYVYETNKENLAGIIIFFVESVRDMVNLCSILNHFSICACHPCVQAMLICIVQYYLKEKSLFNIKIYVQKQSLVDLAQDAKKTFKNYS